jgi:opacity protein-like surface antigen
MRSFKFISIVTSALLASTALATAADLIPMEPVPEYVPEVPRVQAVGGWYLRGDIGYGHASVNGVTYQFPDSTGIVGAYKFDQHELGSAWMLGGGLGYQIDHTFRVDLTSNYYSSMDFKGSSMKSFACGDISGLIDNDVPGGANYDTCSAHDTGSFEAATLLANAYVDLGTYAGFTPYVGAGIGGAHVKWGSLKNDISCSGGDCLSAMFDTDGDTINDTAYDYDTVLDGKHGGQAGWRFAYALHAGASYDLSSRLKLDAGYSMTQISGGKMFDFDSAVGSGVQGHNGDITIHSWRAGLRYQFD